MKEKIRENPNYINIIKTLFSKKNQIVIENKINKLLDDKSRGEISLKDMLIYLSEPDIDFYNLYQNGAKKLAYQGLIIEEKDDEYHYYGEIINNASIDFFVELIITIEEKNDKKIINNFFLEFNDIRKPIYSIVKLLLFSMNNYYGDYEELINAEEGIIDKKINLLTKHRSLYQNVPINDFIYGMFIDGLYTEKQFDKYLSKGSYQLLCEELDKLFSNSNDIIDNNLIKKQLIAIGNMFNNKLFYFSYYGIINDKTKNNLIEQFNKLFAQTLQAFSITFYEEDFIKIEEAKNNSIHRLNAIKTC